MEFLVCSSSFSNGDPLPIWYFDNDYNSSPPLGWIGEPENTVSLALICKSSEGRVHWVVWGISGTVRTIYGKQPGQKRVGQGIYQGVNDFGDTGWTGPVGRGEGISLEVHLYALDNDPVFSESEVTAEKLLTMIEGHVLKETSLSCVCS